MSKIYFVIFFIIFIKNASCDDPDLNIEYCKVGPKPLKVKIKECNAPPCNMYKGENTTFTIKFRANYNTTSLTAQIVGFTAGVRVKFNMPDDNACNFLIDGECPLDEGEEVTYVAELPVLASYPDLVVIIEYSLIGDDDVVACYRTTVFLVKR